MILSVEHQVVDLRGVRAAELDTHSPVASVLKLTWPDGGWYMLTVAPSEGPRIFAVVKDYMLKAAKD